MEGAQVDPVYYWTREGTEDMLRVTHRFISQEELQVWLPEKKRHLIRCWSETLGKRARRFYPLNYFTHKLAFVVK